MRDENQLVQRTGRAIPSSGGGLLRLGMGDDAAILRLSRGRDCILTCDAFLEGVHFLASVHPPDSIGYKALARATSDIAAMGATPRLFLLTLALPAGHTGAWLDAFHRGLARAARQLGLRLAGGDTTRSPEIFISITVLGETARGAAVLRSGARPGDGLYVSGPLGRARLGLELVRRGHARDRTLRLVLAPHLYPRIELKLGTWLARYRVPSAMMDISDGLSTDLARLCQASRVGARIDAASIPCPRIPATAARALGKRRVDPLALALHGGDEYALLFAVPRRRERLLRRAPGFANFARIGEVTRDRRIVLVSAGGACQALKALGWDPFRRG